MKTPKSFFRMLLAIILISTISVFLGCTWFWLNINELSKKVLEKDTALSNFAEKERTLDNLQINYDKTKDNLEKIEFALPEEKEVTSLLTSIENLSEKKGVKIMIYEHKEGTVRKKTARSTETPEASDTKNDNQNNLKMNQVVKEGDLSKITPVLTITGSYPKVQEFIKEMEMLSRLVVLNSIDIKRTDEPDLVSADVAISVYFK